MNKTIKIDTYADMIIDTDLPIPDDIQTDEDWDNYYCLEFAVDNTWAEKVLVEKYGFKSIDDFEKSYTWSESESIFGDALRDRMITEIKLYKDWAKCSLVQACAMTL